MFSNFNIEVACVTQDREIREFARRAALTEETEESASRHFSVLAFVRLRAESSKMNPGTQNESEMSKNMVPRISRTTFSDIALKRYGDSWMLSAHLYSHSSCLRLRPKALQS